MHARRLQCLILWMCMVSHACFCVEAVKGPGRRGIELRTIDEETEQKVETVANVIGNVTNSVDMSTLKRALMGFGIAAKAFTKFGAIFGGFSHGLGAFLPDNKHRDVMNKLESLHSKLKAVSDDVSDLEEVIKWESTKLQYAAVVGDLKEAMRRVSDMAEMEKIEDWGEYKRHKGRLMDHCGTHDCYMALRTLFDGVIGIGEFKNDILASYYTHSGGNRPKMIKLTARLLQILTGGITGLMTYEAAKYGEDAPSDYDVEMNTAMKAAEEKMEAALQKCLDKMEDNMLKDIDDILAEEESNAATSSSLIDEMRPKYDWVDLAAVAYHATEHSQLHARGGTRVERINSHGKNAIVFYRKKTAAKYSSSVETAEKIAKNNKDHRHRVCSKHQSEVSGPCEENDNATSTYVKVKEDLASNNIGWFGIAVVRIVKPCWFSTYCRYSGEMAFTTDWADRAHVNGRWNILILLGKAE